MKRKETKDSDTQRPPKKLILKKYFDEKTKEAHSPKSSHGESLREEGMSSSYLPRIIPRLELLADKDKSPSIEQAEPSTPARAQSDIVSKENANNTRPSVIVSLSSLSKTKHTSMQTSEETTDKSNDPKTGSVLQQSKADSATKGIPLRVATHSSVSTMTGFQPIRALEKMLDRLDDPREKSNPKSGLMQQLIKENLTGGALDLSIHSSIDFEKDDLEETEALDLSTPSSIDFTKEDSIETGVLDLSVRSSAQPTKEGLTKTGTSDLEAHASIQPPKESSIETDLSRSNIHSSVQPTKESSIETDTSRSNIHSSAQPTKESLTKTGTSDLEAHSSVQPTKESSIETDTSRSNIHASIQFTKESSIETDTSRSNIHSSAQPTKESLTKTGTSDLEAHSSVQPTKESLTKTGTSDLEAHSSMQSTEENLTEISVPYLDTHSSMDIEEGSPIEVEALGLNDYSSAQSAKWHSQINKLIKTINKSGNSSSEKKQDQVRQVLKSSKKRKHPLSRKNRKINLKKFSVRSAKNSRAVDIAGVSRDFLKLQISDASTGREDLRVRQQSNLPKLTIDTTRRTIDEEPPILTPHPKLSLQLTIDTTRRTIDEGPPILTPQPKLSSQLPVDAISIVEKEQSSHKRIEHTSKPIYSRPSLFDQYLYIFEKSNEQSPTNQSKDGSLLLESDKSMPKDKTQESIPKATFSSPDSMNNPSSMARQSLRVVLVRGADGNFYTKDLIARESAESGFVEQSSSKTKSGPIKEGIVDKQIPTTSKKSDSKGFSKYKKSKDRSLIPSTITSEEKAMKEQQTKPSKESMTKEKDMATQSTTDPISKTTLPISQDTQINKNTLRDMEAKEKKLEAKRDSGPSTILTEARSIRVRIKPQELEK